MKKFLVFLFVCFSFMSCQIVTRKYGGKTTINLNPGEKLVEATWKDAEIWYLTEPMDSDYVPKVQTFRESSVLGVVQGEVIFVETK